MEEFMYWFNIIAGICSILGFLIAIFIQNSVKKISINQHIEGNNNKQSAGHNNV